MQIDLFTVEVEEADGSIRFEFFPAWRFDEVRERVWRLGKAGYYADWHHVLIRSESDLIDALNGKVHHLIY